MFNQRLNIDPIEMNASVPFGMLWISGSLDLGDFGRSYILYQFCFRDFPICLVGSNKNIQKLVDLFTHPAILHYEIKKLKEPGDSK